MTVGIWLDLAAADPYGDESFAELLTEGRILARLSRAKLARFCRSAPGTLSRWEAGHSKPARAARWAIIEHLKGVVRGN